jgi:hypothetical protein
MALLALIALIIVAILSLIGTIPMVILLIYSGILSIYCFLTLINKSSYGLSSIGKLIFALSLIALIISGANIFFNYQIMR